MDVHIQDLGGSGKYIGASAVQGRKIYGMKISKPETVYVKRTEAYLLKKRRTCLDLMVAWKE